MPFDINKFITKDRNFGRCLKFAEEKTTINLNTNLDQGQIKKNSAIDNNVETEIAIKQNNSLEPGQPHSDRNEVNKTNQMNQPNPIHTSENQSFMHKTNVIPAPFFNQRMNQNILSPRNDLQMIQPIMPPHPLSQPVTYPVSYNSPVCCQDKMPFAYHNPVKLYNEFIKNYNNCAKLDNISLKPMHLPFVTEIIGFFYDICLFVNQLLYWSCLRCGDLFPQFCFREHYCCIFLKFCLQFLTAGLVYLFVAAVFGIYSDHNEDSTDSIIRVSYVDGLVTFWIVFQLIFIFYLMILSAFFYKTDKDIILLSFQQKMAFIDKRYHSYKQIMAQGKKVGIFGRSDMCVEYEVTLQVKF